MHYTKFIIERYKAITAPVEINIGRDKLIPIIGINECGKTTILQGIFAFDYANDSFSATARHLVDVNNLYDAKSNGAFVSAVIEITKTELKRIIKSWDVKYDAIIAGKTTDSGRTAEYATKAKSDISKLRSAFRTNDECFEIQIRRILPQKWYSFSEEAYQVNSGLMHDVACSIVGELPYILYFDDFKDSIENLIEIPTDKAKASTWFQIIERLFKKADPELDVYQIPQKEERQRKGILSKVKKILNITIMREWETFRLDEREALEIDISFIINDEKPYIKLDVVEKDSNGEEHYFYIKDRSKGFYWFFNFVMKLEFNPKVNSTKIGQDAIYLLDEPGSYLHALAQQRLCKKLSSLAFDNAVVYCTHSHYLLDPSIIPLNCIRIAEKDRDGRIRLDTILEHDGSISERRNAFQPVWDALNVRPSLFEVGKEKVILVEGIYDFYSLSMFMPKGYVILPSVGADSIRYFISLLLAWNIDFRALWDNDEEGRGKLESAKAYFGEQLAKKTFRVLPTKTERQKKVILQNLYEGEDLRLIRSELKLNSKMSFEKTILCLFYSSEKHRILEKVGGETKKNFERVFDSLA